LSGLSSRQGILDVLEGTRDAVASERLDLIPQRLQIDGRLSECSVNLTRIQRS
jgi:hypothetical protein